MLCSRQMGQAVLWFKQLLGRYLVQWKKNEILE